VTFTTPSATLNQTNFEARLQYNLTGTSAADTITGGGLADIITGGSGSDRLTGGVGADTLTGSAGADSFRFSVGDSGQSTGFDTITDYELASDTIRFNSSNLDIGGNSITATSSEASISTTTGIATFAAGSGTTLSDALSDIATRFTTYTDTIGEFALFKVNASNNYYLFISDGTAGVTATDVVISLDNVTSIASIGVSSSTLTVMPIAIDLNADGVTYLNRNAGVMYDYNKDGTAESTAWVAGTDGMLAMLNSDGSLTITFSTQAGETDLQGLAKVYDVNLDGILNQQDASFNSFGVWQDVNSDGKVEAGEFKSLTDAGIASLNLVSDGQAYTTAGGDVQVSGGTTYTKADGSVGIAEDVSFTVSNPDTSLTLTGQADSSVITGSQSDDTLTGTLGADVFKWNLNDQGTDGAPANDTITDFSIAEGDSLDLRDLLTGEHDGSLEGVANNLTSYLHFEKSTSGTDTIVSISSNGQFTDGFDSSKVDQTITLANVDLVGTSSQQQIVDDLLKQQVIKLDQ
jgi:hypothetical protein